MLLQKLLYHYPQIFKSTKFGTLAKVFQMMLEMNNVVLLIVTLCATVSWLWPTHLSPLLRAMPMSFSMPPASRRALAFSMFLVMTSCSAQQMAVTVSSDMALLGGPMVPEVPLLVALLLLLLLLPGNRWIKSLMAYLPGVCGENEGKGQKKILVKLCPLLILLFVASFVGKVVIITFGWTEPWWHGHYIIFILYSIVFSMIVHVTMQRDNFTYKTTYKH